MDRSSIYTTEKTIRKKTFALNIVSLRFCFGLLFGYCVASTLIRQLCFGGGKLLKPFPRPVNTSRKPARVTPKNEHSSPGQKVSDRELVFVGIMTTEKYLNTRAKAIYDTWAKTIPGKVLFFIGGGAVYRGDLPVVSLHDVPAEHYPPQRKSFKMLQYMFNHFRHKFEWFVRADDDVYIKGDKMEPLLRSVDSSKLWYIGQNGQGQEDEFGKLGLLGDMPYCMGGPGVIFSHGALSKLGRHIQYCLNSVTTKHEDTEVGRCVQQVVGIGCTSAYEMRKLFYQNYREKNGSFTHQLGNTEETATTLHPLKLAPYVYRVHNFINIRRLASLKEKIVTVESEIKSVEHLINSTEARRWLGDEPENELPNLEAVRETMAADTTRIWDFFSKDTFYTHKSVHIRLKPNGRTDESVVANAGQTIFHQMRESFPNSYVKFDGRLASHIRILPLNGVDMDISFRVSYLSQKSKRTKRFIATTRLKQKFRSFEFAEGRDLFRVFLNSRVSNQAIQMLLPLAGRTETFKRFANIYFPLLALARLNVSLTVILFDDEDLGHYETMAYIETLQEVYPDRNIKLIYHPKEVFSRAKALIYGANLFGNDSLLLFMDVDMIFTADFLKRVQLNTIIGKQVFFPVYFSQYDPEFICYGEENCSVSDFDLGSQAGLWRSYGFGMVGIYKSDFLKIGGFDDSIVGWGKEDVDFFNRVLQFNLSAFRAADRGLIHLYHDKFCNRSLPADRWKMCMNSKADLWSSTRTLYRLSADFTTIQN